jgi:hypothetical protein
MHPSEADSCLVLLAKYPESRKVKTRLLRQVEWELVAELYRSFVLDMVSTLDKSGIQHVVCFRPKSALKKFQRWLGFERVYLPQRGRSMGQMLKNAFIDSYSIGFRGAIVIASDCPDLPEEILKEAVASLENHDAVIGPSPDGGYYIIGFTTNAFSPETFDGVSWSTEKVFKETVSKLKCQGQTVQILPEWRDVDTLADLKDLFERNKNSIFKFSKTMTLLTANQDFGYGKAK